MSDIAILTLAKDWVERIKIDGIAFTPPKYIDQTTVRQWKILKTIAWRSTIHAFKGLEAACVVMLVPQDQRQDDNTKFTNYVAASRVQYKLYIYSTK